MNKYFKIIRILCCLVLELIVIGFTSVRVCAGEQTYNNLWNEERKAYIIQSEEDFVLFRNAIGGKVDFEGKVVLLGNNITLTQKLDIIEKSDDYKFAGYFDGQGYTISDINIEDSFLFPRVTGDLVHINFKNIQCIGANTGIIGSQAGNVNACYFQGEIKSTNEQTAVINSNYGGNIENCIFDIDISFSPEYVDIYNEISGIVGLNGGGTITNCVYIGNMTLTDEQSDKENNWIYPITENGKVTNCFYIEKDYYADECPGTPCTDEALKSEKTYTGFDFENIWDIDDGEGYPYIRSDIDQAYLPLLPNVQELPITYEVSFRDVSYENGSFEPYFPLAFSLPQYTGNDAEIKAMSPAELDTFLKDTCGLELSEMRSEYADKSRQVVPRDGYKLITQENPSTYVNVSYKTTQNSDYKVVLNLVWAAGEPDATFHAGEISTGLQKDREELLADAKEYMNDIINQSMEKFPEGWWKEDSWFAFSYARCLQGSGSISDEELYENIVKSRYEQYLTDFEAYKSEHTEESVNDNVTDWVLQRARENGTKLDRNALVKDILAITALGYDATNVSGLDLIKLEEYSDSIGYFDHYYCQYANYSGRYDEHSDTKEEWKTLAKEWMDALRKEDGSFNFQDPGYTNTDDMPVMHCQPLFLCMDAYGEELKSDMEAWLSRGQTVKGTFPGNEGWNNRWTNAQVHILMGLCDIDWMDDKFVKDGNTVISNLVTENDRYISLTYAADRLQCARALSALIRQAEGKNNLFDCTDVEGARKVNLLVRQFEEADIANITEPEKISELIALIDEARELYDRLSDSKKSAVRLERLEAAEAETAKMKAEQASAALVKAIKDLEPGLAVLKEYLGQENTRWEMNRDFAYQVKDVREQKYMPFAEAYPEIAKQIDISVLEESEQELAKLVYNILKALPRSEQLEEQELNETELTAGQNPEEKEEGLQVLENSGLEEVLPETQDSEEKAQPVEEEGEDAKADTQEEEPAVEEEKAGETSDEDAEEDGANIRVTEEELRAIADGREAYELLTDKAKEYLETMEGGAEETANLSRLLVLAEKYQAYVKRYQELLLADIRSLYASVTRDNLAKAVKVAEQYETEALAKAYVDDESNAFDAGGETVTLKSAMERIKAGITAVQEEIVRIQKAEELISKLPLAPVKTKEEAEAAKALYDAANEYYTGLTPEEQKEVVSAEQLTLQKSFLDSWYADEASAAQAADLIRGAEALYGQNIRSDQTTAALRQAMDALYALNERARTILGTEQAGKLSVMTEGKKADTKAVLEAKGITLDADLPWYVSMETDEIALSGPEAAPLVQVLKNQKRVTAVKAVSMKAYAVRADGSREEYSTDTAVGINLPAVSGLSGKNVWIAVRYADESVGCIQGFAGQSGVAFRSARFGVFVLGADTSDTSAGVEPDDIPQEGIPESFWIAKVADCTYTGKTLKPAVRVYNGDKLLSEGTDYKLSYKNNINANVNADAKAVVTVTGRGNYTGTRTAEFTILPLDVNDRDIMIGDVVAAHTGSMLEAVPEVTYQGKKLVKEKDFTLSGNTFAEEGTYDIILRGTGNFTGEATAKFTITKLNLISQATVAKIPEAARKYNGTDPVTPSLTVKVKKTVLKEGADYEVAFINNEEVGTATAILTGINEYAGTKKVNFQIVGTPLKKAVVTGLEKSYDYTGDPIEAEALAVTLEGKTLSEGTDYKVSYENNRRAGKAGVLIKGTGAYTGTIKKTFKITACDLKANEDKVSGLESLEVRYTKGGSKPEIDLVFDGVLLKEGKDYTVACQNHKKVADAGIGKRAPKVTIKGKGDFKGTLTANFTIVPKALDDEDITFTVADVAFANKKGKYISKPVLTDAGGKKLTAGTDYERTVEYTLDGAPLTKQDIVPEGATVTVKVTGKGAYTGSREVEYRITRYSFNKAKVKISNQAYTGRAVTLDENDLEVKFGTEVLDYGDDYEIVEGSYTKNIKKGTAAVTIAGKGEYGGLKTVKFKIVSQNVTLK